MYYIVFFVTLVQLTWIESSNCAQILSRRCGSESCAAAKGAFTQNLRQLQQPFSQGGPKTGKQ